MNENLRLFAEEIGRLQSGIDAGAKSTIGMARRQGELLSQARELIADDEDVDLTFAAWVKAIGLSKTVADKRIAVATKYEQLPLGLPSLEVAERKAMAIGRPEKLAYLDMVGRQGLFADARWQEMVDMLVTCEVRLANAAKDARDLRRRLEVIAFKTLSGVEITDIEKNEAKAAADQCKYIAK